ncbi:MAG: mechanosensitive ion channel family protein [Myxococcales bacterium]
MDNLAGWLDVGMLRAKGVALGGSVLAALLILVLGRLAARVVATALSRGLQRSHTDVTRVKFLYNLVYALLMAFIVVAALEKIGVSTTSFVGIVAAAGLAIGLALQGSLSNFAAGVMIILLRHFGVGDSIEAAGQKGRVLDIQIFSTVLVTDDGTRVIIPNNAITSGTVKVFAPPAEQVAAEPVATASHAA